MHVKICSQHHQQKEMGDLGMEEGLLKRFRDLEASQEKLREQLGLVLGEGTELGLERGDQRNRRNKSRGYGDRGGDEQDDHHDHDHHQYDVVIIPGYFAQNPYQSVLQHMGHAVHVCRPGTGEIVYWNQSAEHLYGWRNYEALGQRVATLLIDDENYPSFEKVMERLNSGQTWSGQFPFRKKSGNMFMAMVTKSPLYENNELIGVITVSSDGATLDDMNKEKPKAYWNEAHGQQRESKLNFGRLRPQADIASSVSNLASKILPRIRAYSSDECENNWERCGCILETENLRSCKPGKSASRTIFRLHSGLKAIEEKTYKYEEMISKFNQQSKIAAKVLSKLNIGGSTSDFQESDRCIQKNSAKTSDADSSPPIPHDTSAGSNRNQSCMVEDSSHNSKQVPPENLSWSVKAEDCCASDCQNASKRIDENGFKKSYIKCIQCSEEGLEQSGKDDAKNGKEYLAEGLSTQATLVMEQRLQKQVEECPSLSANSVETNSNSPTGSSPVDKKDLNLITECDIQWEDLHLGEEVGQGSYAVVYRGVWNGSDVAIKVYIGNDYNEGLLLDYKKEIAIMKRLRHPNVLLFMGAVYSPQRLAIVTEFLPRGSLFRALHRNNQKLDLKRRLRMALDVARGMNYLHRRNPPIIHRDLKSSNLLVDKNWTVKVGDFGLSCLKISTVMTATSGRGTPQWMAPEVLRGECSNEKSDVFSFGVILWELMTESVPWIHFNPLQVIGVVGFMDRRLDLPASMDPRVSAIICDCWNSDPTRRPSFQELVARTGELLAAVTPPLAHRSKAEHQTRGSAPHDNED